MKQSLKFFFPIMNSTMKLFKKEVSCQRYQSQWSNGEKVDNNVSKEAKNASQVSVTPKVDKNVNDDSQIWKYSPNNDDDLSDSKWKLELAWFTKALEPALQLYRRAMPTGNGFGNKSPTSSRSLMEIVASLQRSKIGLQDWSLSDLTIGLFLIYLKQASETPFEDVKGIQISSDSIVHDLIYHLELAKGAYRDNTAGLARNSMLRESNVVKFIKDSSIMRPGYYIGIDARKRLVILGIRGTQTVYDLITDIATSSTEEVTFEGYSTHFGTAEAARWFLSHEMGTIKKCLEKHEVAIMLRRKSSKELGFSPDIVTAIGYASPPCVSRELAECCSDYVTTVIMQDDIIPRMSALEKEDWRNVIGLVSNAKNVVSSVQDVARKLADYAKFGGQTKVSDVDIRKELPFVPGVSSTSKAARESAVLGKKDSAMPEEELFVPGTLYYLKRNIVDNRSSSNEKGMEVFYSVEATSSYYYALRDVLKGFPGPIEETIFKHK
ncbi:hypothetical protein HYC85_024222 [Camellia sinensis]|uniref:Fungal lipase-type domain-containing protein n=1 Tax=Camellia sinensis TaxID=4442 RepID=A0A7J7GBQ7_CAMSI|nr:hypothetical protein HYC85_024222 [Camellia sinensis]